METKISARIRQLLRERGLKPSPFADKVGIDPGNFIRKLSGVRGWTLENLVAIARGLGIGVEDLLKEKPRCIPIIARATAAGFPYAGEQKGSLGCCPVPPGMNDLEIEGLYALEVADNSMLDTLDQGVIIIAKRESWEEIGNRKLVVFHDANDIGHLRRVIIPASGNIILKSLNPAIDDLSLPRDHLRLCDKIVFLKL